MALDDLLDKIDAALGNKSAPDQAAAVPADTPPAATSPDRDTFQPAAMPPWMPGAGPMDYAAGPDQYATEAPDSSGYSATQARLHGATMGASDPLIGFGADIARGAGGGQYNWGQGAQDIKAARDQWTAAHPYESAAANIEGAAMTAPLLPIARAFGPAMRVADPLLRRLAMVGTGGAVGGAMGAVGGAVDAAPAGGQAALEGAEQGGLVGAAVGAGVPAIGYGIGGAAKAVADRMSWQPALRGLDVGRNAGNAVMRSLTNDDVFGGGQGWQNIERAGPGGMIADAGPSSTGMLDEAISSGGAGALTARNAVNQRATDANLALGGALDTALGAPQGIQTARTAIRVGGAPARSSAYTTAYATPIDYSTQAGTDLLDLLSGVPQRAITHANEMMLAERVPGRLVTTVKPDGSLAYTTPPTVQQIDYITRGLRQSAGEEGAGFLGGNTDKSRVWQNLSGQIRSTLGGPPGNRAAGLVPEYGQALDTAADDISRSQAVVFGGQMLGKTVPTDVVRERVAHMSQAELEAMRQGVRSQLDELVKNVNNAASNPSYDAAQLLAELRGLNSQAAREKLAMIMDPVQQAQLSRQLEMATSAAQLYANTTRNSATAGRLATREAVAEATAPGALGRVARMEPVQAGKRAGQLITGDTPEYTQGLSDLTRGQIADLLTRRVDPATGRSVVVDTLEGILPGLARNAARGQAIERGFSPAVMPAAVQGGRQYFEGPPVPLGVYPPASGGGVRRPFDGGGGGDTGDGGEYTAAGTPPNAPTLTLGGEPAAGPPSARGEAGPSQYRDVITDYIAPWARKVASGGFVREGLPSSYDANRSFAENALDPRGVENALNVALGVGGGSGLGTRAPRRGEPITMAPSVEEAAAARAPAPIGTKPPEGAPAAAAEAPVPSGVLPPEDPRLGIGGNKPPSVSPPAKFPQYAEAYPDIIPGGKPAIDKNTGKEYQAKNLSPEAVAFGKERARIQADMNKNGYEPYFDPSKRSYVDPSNYPGPNVDTRTLGPSKPTTIAKYADAIGAPETAKALRAAYDKGIELGNADHWYAMAQLESEYTKELGTKAGRVAFLDEFATPMAATTSGNNPQANLLMAHFLEHMRKTGQEIPAQGYDLPAPVGGRRGSVNLRDYAGMRERGGYAGLGAGQPKMHDFDRSFLGDLSRPVMDDQMARGMLAHVPRKMADATRTTAYGNLSEPVHALAAELGLPPGNVQDVAWAGFKGEKGKPMISIINEAIERTHRLTGMPKQEIVRRGLVRKEIPIYGLTGVVGAGVAGEYDR